MNAIPKQKSGPAAASKKAARELKGLRVAARGQAVRRASHPDFCCFTLCCVGG